MKRVTNKRRLLPDNNYSLRSSKIISVGKTPSPLSDEWKHIRLSGGAIHQLRKKSTADYNLRKLKIQSVKTRKI